MFLFSLSFLLVLSFVLLYMLLPSSSASLSAFSLCRSSPLLAICSALSFVRASSHNLHWHVTCQLKAIWTCNTSPSCQLQDPLQVSLRVDVEREDTNSDPNSAHIAKETAVSVSSCCSLSLSRHDVSAFVLSISYKNQPFPCFLSFSFSLLHPSVILFFCNMYPLVVFCFVLCLSFSSRLSCVLAPRASALLQVSLVVSLYWTFLLFLGYPLCNAFRHCKLSRTCHWHLISQLWRRSGLCNLNLIRSTWRILFRCLSMLIWTRGLSISDSNSAHSSKESAMSVIAVSVSVSP